MTGPTTPPPPSRPGRSPAQQAPLDPRSEHGREIADRLTRTLAAIELELAQADALAEPVIERAA